MRTCEPLGFGVSSCCTSKGSFDFTILADFMPRLGSYYSYLYQIVEKRARNALLGLLSLLTVSSGKKANCPALYSGYRSFLDLKVIMSVPSSSCFLVKVKPEYEPDCFLASLGTVVVLLSFCIAVSGDFGSGLTIISPLTSSTLTEYDFRSVAHTVSSETFGFRTSNMA